MSLGSDCSLATHRRVRAACESLRAAGIASLRDLTPAYATVVASFDALAVDAAGAEVAVRSALSRLHDVSIAGEPRLVEIPVCYEGECAPDLADVAMLHGMNAMQVAAIHSGAEYTVHFVGFVPGFAYLGGLPAPIATARLDKPRVRVPAGSVGIAGDQTGVYPFATAGGWRLIGRTPLRMFDAGRKQPALLEMGDRVKFVPIGPEEYAELQQHDRSEHALACKSAPDVGVHPALRVIEPGMLTTVQDLGREGAAAAGAPVGGAADPTALRIGNRLVGNPPSAAGFEMTLLGATFEFLIDAVIALTGAEPDARIQGGSELRPGVAHQLRRGQRLKIGRCKNGARTYLCIRGGIDIPLVMNSASTHLAAGIGGLEGRPLRTGDVLRLVSELPLPEGGGWGEGEKMCESTENRRVIRVILRPGFDPASVQSFLKTEYKIASQSDRVGLRLEGPSIQAPAQGRMISEGMMWGAIQVPESGKPIILMCDHPTTGGYPVIACVATIDLPRLGQLRPGDSIRFEPIEPPAARALLRQSARL